MKNSLIAFALTLLSGGSACAQVLAPGISPARQDASAIRSTAEQFLRTQSAGLPGEVQIAVGQLDTRLNLPSCATLDAFLPGGARAWGKTTVGVRCAAPTPWTVFVTAQVKVVADYLITAHPLVAGQLVGSGDIATIRGDLATLAAGVLTDPTQALGRTVSMSVGLGSPLRQELLKSQQAVQQGQAVRLVSNGAGFNVSTEGRALNNAAAGQIAQARTPGGQVVSGVARAGGIVEVTF